MSISNGKGERITTICSNLINHLHNFNDGEILIVIIPELNLYPDIYKITTFLTINGEISDWVINAFEIEVENGDFYGTGTLPPDGQGSFLTKFSMKSILKPIHEI